jgi:hypothetical protein
MKKSYKLYFLFYMICTMNTLAQIGRHQINLTEIGWRVWMDKDANWKDDTLYCLRKLI